MYMTFKKLRDIKHALPTGSVKRIADELGIAEQTVRNYFGAKKSEGELPDSHLHPGPDGGYVQIEDTTILEKAKSILAESQQ